MMTDHFVETEPGYTHMPFVEQKPDNLAGRDTGPLRAD